MKNNGFFNRIKINKNIIYLFILITSTYSLFSYNLNNLLIHNVKNVQLNPVFAILLMILIFLPYILFFIFYLKNITAEEEKKIILRVRINEIKTFIHVIFAVFLKILLIVLAIVIVLILLRSSGIFGKYESSRAQMLTTFITFSMVITVFAIFIPMQYCFILVMNKQCSVKESIATSKEIYKNIKVTSWIQVIALMICTNIINSISNELNINNFFLSNIIILMNFIIINFIFAVFFLRQLKLIDNYDYSKNTE